MQIVNNLWEIQLYLSKIVNFNKKYAPKSDHRNFKDFDGLKVVDYDVF